MKVPFFRPDLNEAEIAEVVDTLRSGWLTTGPKVKRFEEEFAAAVGGRHAIALNSCTAALHLGVHSLGLGPGEAVLVPTMTMAATAEVVRYEGAVPILVDCHPGTLNIDLEDAEAKLRALRRGELPEAIDPNLKVVGIIPVHVSGQMLDLDRLREFAERHSLWIVEDAAHSFPSAWRASPSEPWQRSGEGSAAVSCFSFYANKTITTGEGGMAVTDDDELAKRIRLLSLHGLSADAWGRFSGAGSWDYRIVAPGYKYNLSDIAGALGIHQLARAEKMKEQRRELAEEYLRELAEVEEIELPPVLENRIHSWHLFLIRLRLERLSIDRQEFTAELGRRGIGHSVHWRPLHLHPYYESAFGWQPDHLPNASAAWVRIITLPLFPSMGREELRYVVSEIKDICQRYGQGG